MKKEMKLLIILVLVLMINLSAIVLAQEAGVSDAIEKMGSFIRDLFTKWQGGYLDVNVAKFLFFFLISILIYSILDMTDFPKSSGLKWLIALPVGFLATAYITPEEVFGLISEYSALGLTLGILIPFLILAFFSYAVISKGEANGIALQYLVWIIFGLFLVFRLVMATFEKPIIEEKLVILGIAIFADVVLIALNKPIRNIIKKIQLEATEEAMKGTIEKSTAVTKARAKEAEELGKK